MPTQKARLQVVLAEEPASRVKALAEERGLSVSAMCSQLIHAALKLPEFRERPDLSQLKAEMVKCAIEGGDISELKIATLLDVVTSIEEAGRE